VTGRAPAEPTELRIERRFEASPDEVFEQWTDPPSMAKWLSPTGVAEVVADVRVGGRFSVTMIGDGKRLEHRGEYLRIEPSRVLSFTWISPYTGAGPSVVTVELMPDGAGTRLVLTHEWLPAEHVDPHAGGWGSILDNLAAVLRSISDGPGP
jgi:uncharacterized protein YndB with AHSA1/START domain